MLVGLIALGIAWTASSARAGTPSQLPFDSALALYVGHVGTWHTYSTNQDVPTEIEAPVAVFQGNEEVSDGPENWGPHQINKPRPPDGWTWFRAVCDQPMVLHVIVSDTQHRLRKVTVSDRTTGKRLRTLTATSDGSRLEGTLRIDPARNKYVNLKIAGARGRALAQAAADLFEANDAICVPLSFGFRPSKGAPPGVCPKDADPPYGDPTTLEGKVTTDLESAYGTFAAPTTFTNDAPQCRPLAAEYDLRDKMLLHDGTALLPGASEAARAVMAEAIGPARQPYEGGASILKPYTVLPFSRGIAHWAVCIAGSVQAVICFPYRGKPADRDQTTWSLRALTAKQRAAGIGVADPAREVCRAISEAAAQELIGWRCSPPIPVGNVWGMRASTMGDPCAQPNDTITSPVTIELWGDMTAPGGAAGPIAGSGDANLGQPWTTPPPPNPEAPNVGLTFPRTGQCTVQLAKGFRWMAGGRGGTSYSAGTVDPFRVPAAANPRITAHLEVLLQMVVKTVSANGPMPCTCQLQVPEAGGGWRTIAQGDTVRQANGEEWWTTTNLFPGAGTYQVQAEARVRTPHPRCHSVLFTVAAGRTQFLTVTVTDGGQRGPGEGR